MTDPLSDYPVGATPLDPDEMEGLRFPHITTRGQLDELEQANIETGLRWLSRLRRRDILTDEFVIALHKRLFGEVWAWAGTFRRTEKNIGIDPLQIGIELRTLMDTARFWKDHQTYMPAEAALRLHHRMVQIHPFPNGNGRHARIAADLILERIYNDRPVDWAGGHDLQKMNDRRIAYIAALRAADSHDFGPLLAFAGVALR
ncbi:mobile mystery protein B [Aestuariivirga sp.]|uniref:mobile mystery protein B n=1 Tax=Aestuariivirga sp. TaxID=2650926 RepID=UPI0039E2EB40